MREVFAFNWFTVGLLVAERCAHGKSCDRFLPDDVFRVVFVYFGFIEWLVAVFEEGQFVYDGCQYLVTLFAFLDLPAKFLPGAVRGEG